MLRSNVSTEKSSGVASDHTAHAAVIAPETVRLPIHFFVFSTLWFACASILLPLQVPSAVRFFYQPWALSVVHMLTLGLITSTIMGVMYRYVPALTRRPVVYPRLASLQFAAYAIGVAGMVAHFALNQWVGLWWSAALVFASIILFAINLLPLLWLGFGRGVAETGMLCATCFLLLAALLGLLMGIEEAQGFFWGDVVESLGAHVVFAVVGWVTLTICAASYRFIPAFILPSEPLPRIALWQIAALIVATLGLGVSLLFGLPGTPWWSLAAGAALLVYVAVMAMLLHRRRLPMSWGLGHAPAGMVWLIVGIALAQIVVRQGAWNASGAPLAGALATAALLGWAGNFIIGMSYQLFPGFVGKVRSALRFPASTTAELSPPRFRPFILVVFNTGVFTIVVAFAGGLPGLGAVGGGLVLGAIAPYTMVTLRTLSYAYRRSAPPTGRSGLRVIAD